MSVNPVLADIHLGRVRAHVETITEQFPTRLAGATNGKRMAEYSAAELQSYGVDARVEEFPGLVSFPESGSFRVLGPDGFTLEASTLGHSLPCENLRGWLYDTGSGTDAEFAEGWQPGMIALSELSYNPARQEKERIAAEQDAIACVMMNWGADDNHALPFGSVKAAWGNPTASTPENQLPRLPCIGLARRDGMRLRELLKQGPVEIEITARVENGWRPVQMTTGEIEGKTREVVIVGGHQDSWQGPQATDNATGSACLLELARVFAKHRDKLRRGLHFGFWVGHETGTMIGSSRYADRNWDRLTQDAVAYLQIDQPCCLGTTAWQTMSNPELRRFHQSIEAKSLSGIEVRTTRAMKVGDSSFFGMGIPMFAGNGAYTREELAATANAAFGWWHHSEHNSIDKVEWGFMDAHMRTYAEYLWALCTLPVLPLEFVSVADEIADRLETLTASSGPIDLKPALEGARGLVRLAAKLDAIAGRVAAAAEQNVDGAEAAAETLNACFKDISRALVPLASTIVGTYGHDPYGITAQTTVLPMLYRLPELAAMAQGTPEQVGLEIELLRARNRVTNTLRMTQSRVHQALAEPALAAYASQPTERTTS